MSIHATTCSTSPCAFLAQSPRHPHNDLDYVVILKWVELNMPSHLVAYHPDRAVADRAMDHLHRMMAIHEARRQREEAAGRHRHPEAGHQVDGRPVMIAGRPVIIAEHPVVNLHGGNHPHFHHQQQHPQHPQNEQGRPHAHAHDQARQGVNPNGGVDERTARQNQERDARAARRAAQRETALEALQQVLDEDAANSR